MTALADWFDGLDLSVFGDAPQTDPRPEVSIRSLTGMTSSYWGVKTQNDLYMGDATVSGWDLPKGSNNLENSHESYRRSEADFLVEYDANNLSKESSLPLPQGGHVVDIELYDKDNDVHVVKLFGPVLESDATLLDMSDDQQDALKLMKKPYLRYWVKVMPRQPNYTSSTSAQFGKLDESENVIESYGQFPDEITQSARKNLGVAQDASLEQIVGAVKSKYYSFTPLADSDVKFGPDEKLKLTPDSYFNTLASLPDANCNTAALTVFAASAPNKSGLSIASGYIDSNKDSILSSNERHAWLVNEAGDIIDPTPSEVRKTDGLTNAQLLSILALGGLVGSVVGWRRGNLSQRAAAIPGWNAYLRRVSDRVEQTYFGTEQSRPDYFTPLDKRLTGRLPSLQEVRVSAVAKDAHIRSPLSRIALHHLKKVQRQYYNTR